MNEALKAQIARLREMGIELDIAHDTPDSELSAMLEQIDTQLSEFTALGDIALDSVEAASIANMSAIAIDINVQSNDIIAALGQAYKNDEAAFADNGLAILFKELSHRSLAMSVADSETDPMHIGAIINDCLAQHNVTSLTNSELEAIEQKLGQTGDNIYEEVDDLWFELSHALDTRGISLLQVLRQSDIDDDLDAQTLKLILFPESVSQKWSNRGFGDYAILSFSELFLTE